EALSAIFDDRDRGKNGGKQQYQDDRAREKKLAIAEILAGDPRHTERRPQPGTEQDPEHCRLCEGTENTISLAEESHQFATTERTGHRPRAHREFRAASGRSIDERASQRSPPAVHSRSDVRC